MATRAITENELKNILDMAKNGFTYTDEKGIERKFRPNSKLYLAIYLQANLGLRIGDTLKIRLENFQNGQLVLTEEKTDKIKVFMVNTYVSEKVFNYAIENNIKKDEFLIQRMSEKTVQKHFRTISKVLGLTNVSTHSARKFFATQMYQKSENDLIAVQKMLNHCNTSITEKYINTKQEKINRLTSNHHFDV